MSVLGAIMAYPQNTHLHSDRLMVLRAGQSRGGEV